MKCYCEEIVSSRRLPWRPITPMRYRNRGYFQRVAMNEFSRKTKIHRAFPRRSASAAVKVTCQKKGPVGAGPDLSSIVLDLSQAGARLVVTAPLKVGEEVVLGLVEPSYKRPLQRDG